MQAQNPPSPYFGLWARLDGFRPEELGGAITGRTAVSMPLLRATLHLVTARDCLALRQVLQPVLERNLYIGAPFGRQIAGMDIEAEEHRKLLMVGNIAPGTMLLDEIQVHLVPILLGEDRRLFDNLGAQQIELESTRVIESPGVTHLGYRIVKHGS